MFQKLEGLTGGKNKSPAYIAGRSNTSVSEYICMSTYIYTCIPSQSYITVPMS